MLERPLDTARNLLGVGMASPKFYCPHCVERIDKPRALQDLQDTYASDPQWKERRKQLASETILCPTPRCGTRISVVPIIEGRLDRTGGINTAVGVTLAVAVGAWALAQYGLHWETPFAVGAGLVVGAVGYAIAISALRG